ncbi:MAG: S8 family serine peptidase, partial [Synechococcus sp. SB0665_bin_28]|nr:S8 family serine peptidase [Synechococcus sp. SB0665_bin_28]
MTPEPEPEPRISLVPCFSVQYVPGGNTFCLEKSEFDADVDWFTNQFKTTLREYEIDALGNSSGNWARDSINAYEAYAHLIIAGRYGEGPGEGVRLGFIDSGLHLDHPEFVAQGSESTVFQHVDSTFESSFERSHGTAVVGAAAGLYTGIAKSADVIMFGARDPDPFGRSDFVDLSYSSWYGVFNRDIDILNLSFGPDTTPEFNYSTIADDTSTRDYSDSAFVIGRLYKNRFDAYWDTPISERPIIVQAAGNEGQEHPNVGAFWGLNSNNPFVTVVSVDRQGTISDFSNRCGAAASFCIAAPGEDLRLPSYDTSGYELGFYETFSGTSFAAPIVSGGLAVMKQLFRDSLSDRQLVDRLFATAKDNGIHANSAIYGHGLMDLGAATNPWGIPAFMDTLGANGAPTPLPCFKVSDGDCLTNTELGERARQLTEELKDINYDQINNAWGRDSEAANALKWTAEAVNAHQAAAHLALAHGDGALNEEVTIGFIDTGIHEDHETFDYVSVDEEFLPGAVDEAPYETSHGTAVASLAVGNFLNLPPDSPDFNINVKMFAIPLGDGSGPYRPITLEQLSATDFGDAAELNYVLSQDLDILNLSFGYQGGIENYSAQDLDKHYSRTIEALTQDGRSEKTILVWAAGNTGNRVNANSSSPTVLAGLAARAEELQGHSIAVVSTREDGRISDFSNRCGIAADFCIAAPGEQVLVATSVFDAYDERYYGLDYGLGSGTSYAAPMVSGGLITMKKLFRDQLSNEELVSRLFATANDDGIYADSAIYGQGLMDLGAATNPWGTLSFMDDANSSASKSQPDACFKTHSGDCLTQSELAERARRLTASATLSGVAGIDSYLGRLAGVEELSTAAKYPLKMINAYEALAYLELSRGPEAAAAPGSGVTIGLLNTGIDLSHSMFDFTNSIEEVFLLDATDKDRFSFSQSFGSQSAGIAAGRFGAYGADVKMFVPPSRRLHSDENSRMFEEILNNNLDIFISGSIDPQVDIEQVDIEQVDIEVDLRRSYGDLIEVLAQSEKQDNKTILIWPAGWPEANSEPSSSPRGYGGMTPYIPELQGHSVAVVSVGEDGGISDFSNRCGRAAQFCIAAPGEDVLVAGP